MATKQLDILECKATYTGSNATTGDEYTIYEVTARDPAKGTLLQVPLRSFSNLPLGVGTYEVSKYEKPGKPASYTLKLPRGQGGGGNGGGGALAGRVSVLEEAVSQLKAEIAGMRAERQPVLPGGGIETGTPDPFADDDDIPF